MINQQPGDREEDKRARDKPKGANIANGLGEEVLELLDRDAEGKRGLPIGFGANIPKGFIPLLAGEETWEKKNYQISQLKIVAGENKKRIRRGEQS